MFVENLRISGGEPYKVNRGDFMIDRKTLTINTQIGAVSTRGAVLGETSCKAMVSFNISSFRCSSILTDTSIKYTQ